MLTGGAFPLAVLPECLPMTGWLCARVNRVTRSKNNSQKNDQSVLTSFWAVSVWGRTK